MRMNLENRKTGKTAGSRPPWKLLHYFPVFLFSRFLIAFALLPVVPSALADGGAVLSQQISGPYRVTLFGSPAPLRAGPADLSVLLQDAKTGAPVLDQTVALELQAAADPRSEAWVPPCCSMKLRPATVPATHANAQNKLLYAANLLLPASGPHQILIRIGEEKNQPALARVDVRPPAAPLSSYWSYLAMPPLLVGLFALNQRLRRRP